MHIVPTKSLSFNLLVFLIQPFTQSLPPRANPAKIANCFTEKLGIWVLQNNWQIPNFSVKQLAILAGFANCFTEKLGIWVLLEILLSLFPSVFPMFCVIALILSA